MITYEKEIRYFEFNDFEQYQVFLKRYGKHEKFIIKKHGKENGHWYVLVEKVSGKRNCLLKPKS